MSWLRRDPTGAERGGRFEQRGAGFVALCRDCNSRTGAWYVKEYAAWARKGFIILRQFPATQLEDSDPIQKAAPVHLSRVRPLRFLKQVATMILAINRPEFGDANPDLRSLVLDKNSQTLPDGYSFYLVLYRGPSARYAGLSGMKDLSTGDEHFISEMAYPPFACILSLHEKTPLLPFGGISHFKDYRLDDISDLDLQLLVGFGHTPYPADFRTMAAIQRDVRSSGGMDQATSG